MCCKNSCRTFSSLLKSNVLELTLPPSPSPHRLDFIETKLRRRHYPNDEKKRLEKEVKEIKSHLSRHESNLRSLRGENRVAMLLSVLLLALGVLVYIVYRLLLT